MIPDYEALVRSGYEYLPVGGTLLRPQKTSPNMRSNEEAAPVLSTEKELI